VYLSQSGSTCLHTLLNTKRRRTIQDWKMQPNRTNVGGEDKDEG
jgi:hypothetical protein